MSKERIVNIRKMQKERNYYYKNELDFYRLKKEK